MSVQCPSTVGPHTTSASGRIALPGVGPAWGSIVERKKTVQLPDGRTVEGMEVGYRSSGEHWNEYLTDDGSVIRLKLVATEIVRLDGEYDPQGNPVYLVASTNVMAVSAPEGLRRHQ